VLRHAARTAAIASPISPVVAVAGITRQVLAVGNDLFDRRTRCAASVDLRLWPSQASSMCPDMIIA